MFSGIIEDCIQEQIIDDLRKYISANSSPARKLTYIGHQNVKIWKDGVVPVNWLISLRKLLLSFGMDIHIWYLFDTFDLIPQLYDLSFR